jgi:hypothetical protein
MSHVAGSIPNNDKQPSNPQMINQKKNVSKKLKILYEYEPAHKTMIWYYTEGERLKKINKNTTIRVRAQLAQ